MSNEDRDALRPAVKLTAERIFDAAKPILHELAVNAKIHIHFRLVEELARAIEQESLALNGSAPGAESVSASVAAAEAPEKAIPELEARTGLYKLAEAIAANRSAPGEWLCIRFNTFEAWLAAWRAVNVNATHTTPAAPASAEATDAAPTFDFEILVNDECLASGSCGTREDMEREATHYAAQYESEGEVDIKRYVRYELAAPDADPVEAPRSPT